MTAIRGVFGAVDDVGDPYRNSAEDVRAMLWHTLGGVEGVLEGFAMSTVAAAMEVDFTAGRALIAERGVDITAEDRGYYVFADDVTTVTFDAASVADRCDAVVFAWADPQYGTIGASVAAAGPQIVVVKGVSGSTTPRTDSEINTAIGVGGWFRYADVVIDSTDTEINPASITLTYPDLVEPVGTVRFYAKTADQSYDSASAAGVDGTPDTHLQAPVRAGAKYLITVTYRIKQSAYDFCLAFECANANDVINYFVTGPDPATTGDNGEWPQEVILSAKRVTSGSWSSVAGDRFTNSVILGSPDNVTGVTPDKWGTAQVYYECAGDGTFRPTIYSNGTSGQLVTAGQGSFMRVERVA